MITEKGREAVWRHAGEAGLQDDIKLIAQYFDIKDVSIIYGGKLTYIEELPRKTNRIAVETKSNLTPADLVKKSRAFKR